MLDWERTFSQVIMKSFGHTSPEVKRLSRQIVLQLYKINGTIIRNNFGM